MRNSKYYYLPIYDLWETWRHQTGKDTPFQLCNRAEMIKDLEAEG